MPRTNFTDAEVWWCLYVARYGPDDDINYKSISSAPGRSLASIELKARNIATMLKERGYGFAITPLSGKTTGQTGQEDKLELIAPLAMCGPAELKAFCLALDR